VSAGSMAGREQIWPVSLGLFLESPLYGWGPIQHWYVLGPKVGRIYRDPHSLYLSLLGREGSWGQFPSCLEFSS